MRGVRGTLKAHCLLFEMDAEEQTSKNIGRNNVKSLGDALKSFKLAM